MTSNFKRIVIDCGDNDIKITDGEAFTSNEISYYVEDECLYIEANDDGNIVVPDNYYDEIKIEGTSGDVEICFNRASIKNLEFKSCSGDLLLDALCDYVSFDSPGGDYRRKKGTPLKQLINIKKTMKVKNTVTNSTNSTQSWKNGERYK